MSSPSNMTNHINVAVIETDFETNMKYNDDISKQRTISKCGDATIGVRLSIDGVRVVEDLSSRITITFQNICKIIDIPGKMMDPPSKEKIVQRTLLDNVSGQIHPGQLVALMGPSGCGKTTLLNTLAGRSLNGVTGNIWLNHQLYEKSMKRILAYVLQEDIFFENLTVKQQLTYTALLRLPNNLTRKDKLAQVEQIIEQLHLQNCANTPILLISGGQKRRVNIGTELLTNPSVIFLDEPTSGLDSTSAVTLMRILRELALKGKTIMMSIHQPSSQIFQSFDQLILLADAKTIFMGKPSNALDYFATLGHHAPLQYNPADFIMDLVNQDNGIREELKEAYIQNKSSNNIQYSTEGQKYLIDEPNGEEIDLINKYPINLMSNKNESKWPIGFFAQTWILFSRNWVLTSKSQFTRLNCIQAVFITIIFGLFWLRMKYHENTIQDRSSFIFFLLIFWPLEICFGGVLSFPSETSVINKERASGSFRLSAYYFAKCLSETPIKLVLPAISLTIMYWMVNVNSNFANFLGILCFLLMSVLVAESVGLFFGALFQDVGRAWVACNVSALGFLLAVGYFSHSTPYWLTVWVKWISFFTYAYNGCMQLQFMGERTYQCTDGAYIDTCKNNPNGTFISNEAIKYFNLDLNVGFNFLVLFGMFIVYRIAAYIALRFSNVRGGRT
ncbi:unnamed protein product [Adineta steineri]|uniref:ABC transporter domain-containing protein n=1 Tax=Adineta steineri TaxID=433720 RepID=A0A816ACJ1_9BILA|nr:unnamed protein product [Adineta steineri]CAF1594094.1 unnamed protein product [Adineta steineri]